MMKSLLKSIAVLALTTSTLTACETPSEESSPSTGSGFTSAALAKEWESGCIVATDPITGNTRTKIYMEFYANGAFSYNQMWFSGSSCVTPDIAYMSTGTYTIGSVSGELYPLNFTVAGSTMMTWTNTAQTSVNTACGGTSPYAGNVANANNGQSKSTYMMTCQNFELPASNNKFVTNAGKLSGTVLNISTPDFGVPGIFGTSVPTSTDLDLYPQ
ncbi:hypothetical protein ACLSU7_10795 [Bdellovibrio sp. HCB185ZH]|uniref:hypothetical protein n=1 Tax=Bdellovibrio sp. HCB185ZH TaxID=3394235 RepID=UPI0039A6C633